VERTNQAKEKKDQGKAKEITAHALNIRLPIMKFYHEANSSKWSERKNDIVGNVLEIE
jgi:hypothetical protein